MRLIKFAVMASIAVLYFDSCEAAQKLPVPSEQEQSTAQKTIDSTYRNAFRASRTSPQKNALATQLMNEAASSQSPANRFALYMTAKDLYVDADQHHNAIKVLKKAETDFSFDGTEQIKEVLIDAGRARVDAFGRYLISYDYREAVLNSLQDGDLKLAETLAEHAEDSARNSRNKELLDAAKQLVNGVENFAEQQEKLDALRDTLKSNPGDPAANLEVGKYVCLIEQNWQEGLKLLQKSGNLQWSLIAGTELAESPNALKAGDVWWEVAETLPEIYQMLAQRRAAYWYDQTLETLTGIEQTKVEQRLASLNPQVKVTGMAARPNQFQTRLANDRHKGSAASAVNTENNIYFLELRKAQKLNALRLRFNAEMSGEGRSHGNISLSLDGETWFKVGDWSTESCQRAANFANWNEIVLQASDLLTIERMAVKFDYTGGSHGLYIYEVDLVQ
ncbi:MAG: hypothetical protein HUJ26_24420 [Planctomycetaceae bacterium]|nr:hypothetical protein [Planctomycetaceae bacterium]